MFQKLSANSRVHSVTEQIESVILEGKFKPGDRLPSLVQLQEMFGTGRSTIREALKVLTQKGLVEIRQGAGGGTFVKTVNSRNVIESLGLLIKTRKISRRENFSPTSLIVSVKAEIAWRGSMPSSTSLCARASPSFLLPDSTNWHSFSTDIVNLLLKL